MNVNMSKGGSEVSNYRTPKCSHLIGNTGSNEVNRDQGDQIGRIFAQWVDVYFGQLLQNYRSIPQIWATLLYG
jgi:hypothetical protein